jgi:hypothetical protein
MDFHQVHLDSHQVLLEFAIAEDGFQYSTIRLLSIIQYVVRFPPASVGFSLAAVGFGTNNVLRLQLVVLQPKFERQSDFHHPRMISTSALAGPSSMASGFSPAKLIIFTSRVIFQTVVEFPRV